MDAVSKKNIYSIPWWRGIRGKLILFLIIVLALSLIIFNVYSILTFKSYLFRIGREKNLDLAQKIVEEVETSMEVIIRDLFSISRIWPKEGESMSERFDDLKTLKNRNENIRILSIFDIQGNKLFSVSGKDPVLVDELMDQSQGEKIESFINGNIYIGRVYPGTQTLPLVDVSIPLKSGNQNQVRGILTAIISLRGVYKKLEAIKLKRGQELYLVDTSGLVIAYFSHLKDQKVLDIKGLIPFWANLVHIQKVKQYVSGISDRKYIRPHIYKNFRQQDVLGALSICPDLKWGVIVEESVNILLEPITLTLKKNIIISILIFIVVSLLFILFIGFIFSPLIRLYQVTENLGLELDRININGDDEICRISKNVDKLIKNKYQQNKYFHHSPEESNDVNQSAEKLYNQSKENTENFVLSRENLKGEKDLTEKLIDSLHFLIIALDLNGNVLIYNRSCEKKIGYNSEVIIGKNWFDMVYLPDERSVALDYFHKVLKGNVPDVFEDQILNKDKHPLKIEWHSSIINDSKNLVDSVILVGEDITLKRKKEEELKNENIRLLKKNDDLENILSIVSHDLKNPLYILQDFAYILLKEYKDSLSEDGLYYLERIRVNAQLMERLILDFLELSRVSKSKGIPQEFAISDLVHRALEEFREVIKNKGIHVRISDNFPICSCEPERMLQVFKNLLSNSIKFMRDVETPFVEIGYQETQKEHEFFVKDNGIGIDKEYHDKIFVLFQRLQEVKDVEGTGVGLTIVKKIVEDHGGKVWVESKKGEGAVFYFTIPKNT